MTQASIAGTPIRIKILRTPEEQAEGFMFKPEPENGFGLLFVYKTIKPLSFWMRNVPYDLDLVALDGALCVRKVYSLEANEEEAVKVFAGSSQGEDAEGAQAKPGSGCQYALEMRSGWCRSNGILIGDKLKVNEEL